MFSPSFSDVAIDLKQRFFLYLSYETYDGLRKRGKKTLAKGWKIAIAVVVSAVLLCGAGFGIAVAVPYIEAANFDVSGTPFESPYRLDENGYFVANIPYGDYLVYDAALDRDPTARQPVLSDDADPGKRRGSAFVYSRDI